MHVPSGGACLQQSPAHAGLQGTGTWLRGLSATGMRHQCTCVRTTLRQHYWGGGPIEANCSGQPERERLVKFSIKMVG